MKIARQLVARIALLQEKLVQLWFGPEKRQILRDQIRLITDKISWTTRVSGVLLSVLSMHFLVVRPLVQRVDQLQRELTFVDAALSKVDSERAAVLETNELLSSLKSQHDEVAGARATIRQLQKLRDELISESDQFPAAMRAVKRMSELPDHVFQAEADRYSHLVPDTTNAHPPHSKEFSGPVRFEGALNPVVEQEVKLLDSKIVSTSRELPAQEGARLHEEWKVTITGQESQ